MKPEKRSLDITARIEEAKTRLGQIESDLAGIAREQKKLLTGDEFDNGALSKLEEKRAALTREQKFLQNRIDILEVDREKAETEEAQERLNALPAETELLRTKSEAAMERVNAALASLIACVTALGEVQQEHDLRSHEQVYLADRYKGVTRSSLGSPLPLLNFGELVHDLQAAFNAAVGSDHFNEWQKKRRDWNDSGRRRTALHAA